MAENWWESAPAVSTEASSEAPWWESAPKAEQKKSQS